MHDTRPAQINGFSVEGFMFLVEANLVLYRGGFVYTQFQ